MISREYGYMDNPADGLGIIRARTLIGNLRVWDIPRDEQAFDAVVSEINNFPIPGLYMLFDKRGSKKVYIGQTENLKNILTKHIKLPEKTKNWDRALIINDGRNAAQSDLNDENIRLLLENYLAHLLKINGYQTVTSSSRISSLSAIQKILVRSFKEEIVILLTGKCEISEVC